jgi:WD40 repeat protein
MKTIVTFNARPLSRLLFAVLTTCAAFLALPERAHAQLYVGDQATGIISEYNATTGEVINANFIAGLSSPYALALSGDYLFVANSTGSVGLYDAKTGAAINPSYITGTNFSPTGLALSGQDLFVANPAANEVWEYNARGAEIHAFVEATGDLIAELGFFSKSVYFLSAYSISQVNEIETKTGVVLGTINVSSPYGIAFLGNTLFVGLLESGTIAEYDAETLELINASFITGLNEPFQIALLGDTLFVANYGNGTVGAYDANSGAVINASFVSGLTHPIGVAVKIKK